MRNDFFEKIENFIITILVLCGVYAIFLHWK